MDTRSTGHARRQRRRLFAIELRRLLGLAGPIIVSQLGQVGMNAADTIMVGPLGARSLAAAGLGSAIHFFGIVCCVGVLVGLSPLVSQAFGAGDTRRCRHLVVQGLWLAIALSAPVIALSLGGHRIALLFGQDPTVSALTGGYMAALAWGITPFFLFIAFRQYLEGMGRVHVPMVITFIGLAVNVAANRVFIYGLGDVVPAMGVAGSGVATSIVRWSMLLAIAGYTMARPRVRLRRHEPVGPDRAMLRDVLRVGLPVGGQFGLEVGLFSFAAVMMGWLGPLQLAAHQVTINIASTTFMVALGVSMAGSIRVGQHIGAARPRRMRRAALATWLLSVAFMGACALGFLAAPNALIGLYTDDPAILALGRRLLLVAAAFQVFDGAQVAGISVLRGAAETRVPALIAAVGYWGLGLPAGYLLAFPGGRGPEGVWLGLTVGLAAAALLLALRARDVFWRTSFETLRARTRPDRDGPTHGVAHEAEPRDTVPE
jgi:MATE family multidrug resistance protein